MQPGKALTRPHQLILRFCRPAEALVESHCLPPIVPQGGRFVNAALCAARVYCFPLVRKCFR